MRVSRSEQQAVVERFLAALRTGRLQDLLDVMAPDVVLIADGGGLVSAALVPIDGAAEVAPVLARVRQVVASLGTTVVSLNGEPAARVDFDGEPAAISLEVADGRVARIYVVRNPQKLTRLEEPAELAR